MHLDSANECDVILEGELEVELNGETRTAAQSVLRAAHRPPTTWFAVTGTS